MYQYRTVTVVTDDGAKIAKLICHLPQALAIGQVHPEQFNVFVARKSPTGDVLQLPTAFFSRETAPAAGYRSVTAAYTSDETGCPVALGDWLTLELDLNDRQAGAIAQVEMKNHFVQCDYRVTQLASIGSVSGMVFDEFAGDLCPQTARWQNAKPGPEGAPLQYGYFTPDAAGERPLIIWLHGAGEGGNDPRVAYMGNNVVNLSSPEIQAYFGGAYVLAPQTPTFWMNDGSGTYGRTSRSIYVAALKALIDGFVAEHPIDRARIYIGGCSNGGFMTMRMLVDFPGYFAGAFPMCEAFYDENLSDGQIAQLARERIWFVHAMTDMVVSPEETSVPTYKRLMAAGAQNVHFNYINDRPPFQMVNHGCWVPGLADRVTQDFDGSGVLCGGKAVTLFQWLAQQRL